MKTRIFLLMFLLIVLGVYAFFGVYQGIPVDNNGKGGDDMTEIKQYQGPVPEGYDEKYFRETGITKPLEDVDG